MITVNPTSCCALCHITCSNDDPIEDLKAEVDKLKEKALAEDYLGTGPDYGGQRAAFVIVTPAETTLRKNLEDLGFKLVNTFDRRNGYPKTGRLSMYMLNW